MPIFYVGVALYRPEGRRLCYAVKRARPGCALVWIRELELSTQPASQHHHRSASSQACILPAAYRPVHLIRQLKHETAHLEAVQNSVSKTHSGGKKKRRMRCKHEGYENLARISSTNERPSRRIAPLLSSHPVRTVEDFLVKYCHRRFKRHRHQPAVRRHRRY